jgi:hypothetical protein
VVEIPHHHWRARWRAWRKATRPGPTFDLQTRLSAETDDLLTRWAADLSWRDRYRLNRSYLLTRGRS